DARSSGGRHRRSRPAGPAAVIACAVLLAAPLAACGGRSDVSETTVVRTVTAPPPRERTVQVADAQAQVRRGFAAQINLYPDQLAQYLGSGFATPPGFHCHTLPYSACWDGPGFIGSSLAWDATRPDGYCGAARSLDQTYQQLTVQAEPCAAAAQLLAGYQENG